MARDGQKKDDEIRDLCRNRRAAHEDEILDRLGGGLGVAGTAGKSRRDGLAMLEDAYAKVEGGEVWLLGAEIPEYPFGNRLNHKPKRPRKLLLHRREIAKVAGKAGQQGVTPGPLRPDFKRGKAKVEIAVAKGKQRYDKRQSMKTADAQREIARAMASRKKR